MRLGALLTFARDGEPGDIVHQATRYESEGFESIWTAHAMGRGFILTDPFIALAAVASVTHRVEIGTAILQLPLYHPTDMALKVWSLQQLSGGRFLLGVGAGSTEADYRIHQAAYPERFSAFNEKLARLRNIFETGQAENTDLSPWPSVQGPPPIFYGTWGKGVARAAGEFDGWIASGMHRSPAECAEALKGYRDAGGGRAIVSTIQLSGDTDLGAFREMLQGYEAAGFDDAVVMFLAGAPDPSVVRAMIS